MLHVKNLLKKFGHKTVLNIEELFIPPGITHLKGINGSGKTTFSRIAAGLIPFKGEVLLDNKYSPMSNKVQYRKLVNYAESEPLYPEFFTANDLIAFIGKAKGASKQDQKRFIELFGVDGYLYDTVGTYSSGMLKRLSLCLAFLGSPSLILLDEPFNTLDTDAIDLLKTLTHDQHRKAVNFILVSHQDVRQLGMNVDNTFLVRNHGIEPV
jgi:ABC-2 type transport system ATP-binding protein